MIVVLDVSQVIFPHTKRSRRMGAEPGRDGSRGVQYPTTRSRAKLLEAESRRDRARKRLRPSKHTLADKHVVIIEIL